MGGGGRGDRELGALICGGGGGGGSCEVSVNYCELLNTGSGSLYGDCFGARIQTHHCCAGKTLFGRELAFVRGIPACTKAFHFCECVNFITLFPTLFPT